ncbi:hypothetical protein BXT86_06710 [candidate division WOR-3 bacterium 4484_100]|uniref:Uncharacterized protein n=1 Tax=candidate division WOR-3 bacterium 4484_100 TaxID=1936077 RepID=A0A1V4QDH9_UNCW3|nr:MAG: hypothetical protein BXT86_06710 [candidate division WOR-3 bacterium 4484_100]
MPVERRFIVTFFLIALGVVIIIWLISIFIQRADKARREEIIRKRLEEKKKEEEAKEKSVFR